MRAFVVTGPARGRGAGGRPPGRRRRARSSSTSTASASAAPTSSSSPARWPTCTTGHARYPDAARPRVVRRRRRRSATASTRPGSGRRVTGDTMLGCGALPPLPCRAPATSARTGSRSASAAASRARSPSSWPYRSSALHALPDAVDDAAGALVEPGGNALRAVRAAALDAGRAARSSSAPARSGCWSRGSPGRRASRCTCSARSAGTGRLRRARSASPASGPGRPTCRRCRGTPSIDASNARDAARARRSTWSSRAGGSSTSGWPARPSLIDTRTLVLKDVTAVGILSGSPGLAGTIERYAAGAVDPRPLVAATVGLDGGRRAGRRRPAECRGRPEDPRRPAALSAPNRPHSPGRRRGISQPPQRHSFSPSARSSGSARARSNSGGLQSVNGEGVLAWPSIRRAQVASAGASARPDGRASTSSWP